MPQNPLEREAFTSFSIDIYKEWYLFHRDPELCLHDSQQKAAQGNKHMLVTC